MRKLKLVLRPMALSILLVGANSVWAADSTDQGQMLTAPDASAYSDMSAFQSQNNSSASTMAGLRSGGGGMLSGGASSAANNNDLAQKLFDAINNPTINYITTTQATPSDEANGALMGANLASSSLLAAINNTIAGYGPGGGLKYLMSKTPKIAETINSNSSLMTVNDDPLNGSSVLKAYDVKTDSSSPNLYYFSNIIGQYDRYYMNRYLLNGQSSAGRSMTKLVAKMPGTDFPIFAISNENNIYSVDTKKVNQVDNSDFSFNSLMMPLKYNAEQPVGLGSIAAASNFISVVSNIASPPLLPNDPGTLYENRNNVEFQQYMSDYRAYAASVSIALGNLEYILARRMPPGQLGQPVPTGVSEGDDLLNVYQASKKVASKQNDKQSEKEDFTQASALELEKYLASRRLTNKKWYEQMESSPPATVEREILYLLAEMRYEMYQMRLENERLIAAMSASVIKANVYQRSSLKQQFNNVMSTSASATATSTKLDS